VINRKPKEKRSFVRADLSFKVKFRVITQEEYEEIKETRDQILSSDNKGLIFEDADTDNRFNDITANQCVVDFLFHMDEKLDRILTVLSKDEPDIVLFNQGVGVDIGGAGMKMTVDSPVEHGRIIQINLVLSKFPFIFIDVFGEVVRAEPVNEDGKTVYLLGIKFLDLDINDREKIIARVFKRQREEIRGQSKD
jgi:c-di-GMP-binding flagellar brake protein YcgR